MDKETQALLLEFHRNTISDIKAVVFEEERLSTEYIARLFDLEKRIFNKLINALNEE